MQSISFTARSASSFRLGKLVSRPHQYFGTATRLRVRHTGQSPEEVEQKKNEQIKKQEQGDGEWHESLASSSESHVKADQEKVNDHDEHIEELQKETAKAAEKEK